MQLPLDDNDPGLFAEADENQYFDRKSARLNPKETARHICAFANASGGKLVIGMEDDDTVTGFKRGERAASRSSNRRRSWGVSPCRRFIPCESS